MNEQELLYKVKRGLGITANYHDDILMEYISEVKRYLIGAGVKPNIVNSEASSGVITKGVSDLWNYGSGVTQLSPYFYQRVSQLALRDEESTETTEQVEE